MAAAFKAGNAVAKGILESYAKAEFFTKLPEVDEAIEVVTYIAGEGDISTDLLSPGNQAHSRSDRELHGKCMISPEAQIEIQGLQAQHPGKRVMLIAEKGTMGVGSSRMSGVNNVALWTGHQASPYVPFVNIAPVVAGTNGISPIFLTTVRRDRRYRHRPQELGQEAGCRAAIRCWMRTVIRCSSRHTRSRLARC